LFKKLIFLSLSLPKGKRRAGLPDLNRGGLPSDFALPPFSILKDRI